jgi:ubiquinone/menaquinone biosynthesis C-methylase UbiE
MKMDSKRAVAEYWNVESCGEIYAHGESERVRYETQASRRYALEPYLAPFARFEDGRGRDILEIGVGMGADHLEWAKAGPRRLFGLDLTPRALSHTATRFKTYGLKSLLLRGDAENLPFADASLDLVYSWGVLQHTPDTPTAIREVHRVLRPGGTARVMIYHRASVVGYLLWLRYGLLSGRPGRTLDDVYANHLQGPGTKAYSVEQAHQMFSSFRDVVVRVQLSFGDLLQGEVASRHGRGAALDVLRWVWPRPLIRGLLSGHGLYLLIEARK